MNTPLSSSQVYQVLRYYFGSLIPESLFPLQVLVLDKSYFSTYEAEFIRNAILSDPTLAPNKYRRDIFDCDDYVLYLKTKIGMIVANATMSSRPHAFGVLLTDSHAFNLGIGEGGALYVINTQSNNREFLYPQSAESLHEFLNISNTNRIKLIIL